MVIGLSSLAMNHGGEVFRPLVIKMCPRINRVTNAHCVHLGRQNDMIVAPHATGTRSAHMNWLVSAWEQNRMKLGVFSHTCGCTKVCIIR